MDKSSSKKDPKDIPYQPAKQADLDPFILTEPVVSHEAIQQDVARTLNPNFKRVFMTQLGQKPSFSNLKRIMNFRDDPDWRIRFEIAKLLKYYLVESSDAKLKKEVFIELHSMQSDEDASVRLFVVDVLKSYQL